MFEPELLFITYFRAIICHGICYHIYYIYVYIYTYLHFSNSVHATSVYCTLYDQVIFNFMSTTQYVCTKKKNSVKKWLNI